METWWLSRTIDIGNLKVEFPNRIDFFLFIDKKKKKLQILVILTMKNNIYIYMAKNKLNL